jgi:phospholipid/cholesterol/gamma-HCH transport system substrate-binding protein
MRRAGLIRIIALGLTVIAGFGYILFGVVGWRVGAQRYPVTVVLSQAGGIYPGADVTYRGVTVGRVTSLTLSRNAVAVHLGIDPGVRIPADSTASVKELDAAGEQYMDLVPTAPSGPDLVSGSVIGEAHTSIPISIDTTLIDFGQLLSSLNTSTVETLDQELSAGLGGTGSQFRTLVTDLTNLLDALRASEPSQVELQVDGATVLRTALRTKGEFAHFSTSLRKLTGRVAASNGDLNALIANGSRATPLLHTLLREDSPDIESFVSGLGTITDTAYARNPAIRALFQALPMFAGNLAAVSTGGTVNTELLFNTADTICPYLPDKPMPSPTQKAGSPDLGLDCTASAPDLLARGAAHAPRPRRG